MKKTNYQLKRIVRHQLEQLGLDRAERILVETCDDCPMFLARERRAMCGIGATVKFERNQVPPHDCPLREKALSVALNGRV